MTLSVADEPRLADFGDAVRIIQGESACIGLILFGSEARGDASSDSDLDVLLVYRGDPPLGLLDIFPDRASVAFYDWRRLASISQQSPLFALHLALEGTVLHDPTRRLREFGPPGLLDRAAIEKVRASTLGRYSELLEQPSSAVRAGPELYALAKQAAMLHAAAHGRPEFNRHRAFARLVAYDRRLGPAVRFVETLEAAWLDARARTGAIHAIDYPKAVFETQRILDAR